MRIDFHVHIVAADGLADAADAGVTALRDAGTREGAGLALTRSESPRVLSAGRALRPEGGYGGRFGVAVATPYEVRAEISSLKRAGAGIIKVMASGPVSLSQRGPAVAGGFGRAMLERIAAEAGALGLAVMAHANGGEAITAACEAGAVSIEHGFFMTGEALERMKRRDTLWVPTVGALQRAAQAPNAPPDAERIASETIEAHLVMVRMAYELGVRLGIGTDCMLPDPRYREAYDEELRYFERAGIPPEEVQRIAGNGGKDLAGLFEPRMNANVHEVEAGERCPED